MGNSLSEGASVIAEQQSEGLDKINSEYRMHDLCRNGRNPSNNLKVPLAAREFSLIWTKKTGSLESSPNGKKAIYFDPNSAQSDGLLSL
jgi:hypothetical protein